MLTYMTWPQRVIFGADSSTRIGKEARKMGMHSILLVTDPGLVSCGIAEDIKLNMNKAGLKVDIFSNVVPNPTDVCVHEGLITYNNCNTDGIVALGGGSAMDTAKAIGLMNTHPEPMSQYDGRKGGMAKIVDNLPPLIAIPTTSGTGSEVSSFTVITDTEQRIKLAIGSPYLIPKLALVDPKLTLNLPAEITVNTGVDALTHLVEGYVSTVKNPLVGRMALFGLELLKNSLRTAVKEPGNLDARSEIMMAAMTGALVYNQKFLGMNHSMAHALSALYGTPHGLANGLVLPFTMRFNKLAQSSLYDEIGKALGGVDGILEVESLLEDLGMVLGIRNHGMTKEDVGILAAKALDDPSHTTNPRQPVTKNDFENIFVEAY